MRIILKDLEMKIFIDNNNFCNKFYVFTFYFTFYIDECREKLGIINLIF